ncbi:MAG: YdcF family protein [Deltaproteobacteria bacterium]|jgi:uncharacterized SAM-binding protein YcdF (DUF218 family)|nr:YdcF family protein [Deltaproteobacteria bacterium]
MYFVLSKLLGWLTDPLRLALTLAAVAAVLYWRHRLPRVRRGLLVAALAVLWLSSTGAVSSLLCNLLESRHPRPTRLERAPAAIVMLTGQTDDARVSPSYYELTESSDRFVETLRLARRYPGARVLLSGGSGALIEKGRQREASVLARLAREIGLEPGRLLVDDRSRNTRENAVESARLLDQHGLRHPVLLVTSAVHMPRAVACFREAGQTVIPWPVDYQRHGFGLGAFLPKSDPLLRNRMALHEIAGLLAYWIMGYI